MAFAAIAASWRRPWSQAFDTERVAGLSVCLAHRHTRERRPLRRRNGYVSAPRTALPVR